MVRSFGSLVAIGTSAMALFSGGCRGSRHRPTPVAPFATVQVDPVHVDPAKVDTARVDTVEVDRAAPAPTAAPAATPTAVVPAPAAPVFAPAPSIAPALPAATEAELRTALATADDPTSAALALAELLGQQERHAEALAALAVAEQRQPHPALQLQRAELLRDLGQRHRAVAELRQLRDRLGEAALPPAARLDLAELEWLEGDRAAATATFAALRADPAASAFCTAAAVRLAQLERELTQPQPTRLGLRDCLGNLRGGATPSVRIAMLQQLTAVAGDQQQSLRIRVLAIAAGDESPAVRMRAVQLAVPADGLGAAFIAAALVDAAPLVRRAAAAQAAALAGPVAVSLLGERLRAEDDESTFVAVHRALAAIDAATPALPIGAAATAAGRAAVAAAWERR
jgi:hypothetical protein